MRLAVVFMDRRGVSAEGVWNSMSRPCLSLRHGVNACLPAVPAEAVEPVLIQLDAETGSGWHRETELAVVERLRENFLGQHQRAEKLGAPLEPRKRGEKMRRGDRPNRAFEHGATIEA